MQMGLIHEKAPELRVPYWIDSEGKKTKQVKLSDLGDGYKVLYCFQHWCPGCHSRGFPTLKYLVENLSGKGFEFAAIQTVFEGGQINTAGKLRVNQEQYGLKIPFGYDAATEAERYPTMMKDYRTAGTPWFTVIDPDGDIVFADFRIDPNRLFKVLGGEGLEFQ